jgi:photosystem II stability/assembly factor-like uncharacterized protein
MKAAKYSVALFFTLLLSCERSLDPSNSSGWHLQHKFQDNITYYAIEFTDQMNGWAVGYSGTIKNTSDGGNSWTSQKSGVSSNLWDVCFIDNKTGWICGENNTVLKTENGGKTWQNIAAVKEDEKIITSIKFIDVNNGWASSNKGEILKTVDGGINWGVKKMFNLGGGSYLSVLSENTMYFYHGNLFRTFDGGMTWDSLTVTKLKNYAITDILFTSENNGYLTFENGTGGAIITEFPILITEDGCKTWQSSDYLHDAGFRCVFFTDELNGWVAGIKSVYRTTDSGKSWTMEFSPSKGYLRAKDICFVNNDFGWIINWDGKIYKFEEYPL